MVASIEMTSPLKEARDNGFVTRGEVARQIGVSKSTVIRHAEKYLKPVLGPSGTKLFAKNQLKGIGATIPRRGPGRPKRTDVTALVPQLVDGETAAQVFTMLENGHHTVEIVTKLKLSPHIVCSLHDQWALMRHAIVLSLDVQQVIHELPGFSTSAIDGRPQTVDEFLDDLERTINPDAGTCGRCHETKARFCSKCAQLAFAPKSVPKHVEPPAHRRNPDDALNTGETFGDGEESEDESIQD